MRIFISHSHHDREWCRAFAKGCTARGYDAWYDPKGIHGGNSWVAVIERELETREVFVLVLTPEAWASPWVQQEIQLALAMRKKIVLLKLREAAISGILRAYQWIDVSALDGTAAASHAPVELGETTASVATSLTVSGYSEPIRSQLYEPASALLTIVRGRDFGKAYQLTEGSSLLTVDRYSHIEIEHFSPIIETTNIAVSAVRERGGWTTGKGYVAMFSYLGLSRVCMICPIAGSGAVHMPVKMTVNNRLININDSLTHFYPLLNGQEVTVGFLYWAGGYIETTLRFDPGLPSVT